MTLLSQGAGGFRPKRYEGVQILHDANHWVATACIGGDVLVADSLRRPVSPNLARQLHQLYPQKINRKTNLMKVSLVPCSKQPNASDCGLFASAVAFEWVKGGDGHNILWDVASVRGHLEQCLTGTKIVLFPRCASKKRGRKETRTVVRV